MVANRSWRGFAESQSPNTSRMVRFAEVHSSTTALCRRLRSQLGAHVAATRTIQHPLLLGRDRHDMIHSRACALCYGLAFSTAVPCFRRLLAHTRHPQRAFPTRMRRATTSTFEMLVTKELALKRP